MCRWNYHKLYCQVLPIVYSQTPCGSAFSPRTILETSAPSILTRISTGSAFPVACCTSGSLEMDQLQKLSWDSTGLHLHAPLMNEEQLAYSLLILSSSSLSSLTFSWAIVYTPWVGVAFLTNSWRSMIGCDCENCILNPRGSFSNCLWSVLLCFF